MDYKQTLDTLYNMLPDFQKVGAEAYKPGLERITGFVSFLGDPHCKYRIIHIAGTNGKGSVSHMLASVMTAAGYRTGLYTSPHLHDFRERIRIDGEMIAEEDVVGFAERYLAEMELGGLSFFEATAAMAFHHFARNGVDIAIVETGLGGRLDATNIVTPVLSVITNIGLDHTDLLGETKTKIAREKAGIIKYRVPVVIGEKDGESDEVFQRAALEHESPIVFAEDRYRYIGTAEEPHSGTFQSLTGSDDDCPPPTVYRIEDIGDGSIAEYPCDLTGLYQRRNIVTVLAALDVLGKLCGITIEQEVICKGLATAALSTGLRGRWQILGRSPLVVCDTGHNAHGISQVVRQIAGEQYRRLYMVIGFVADKDLGSILPLLPKEAYYIFTSPSISRAMPADELAARATLHGLGGLTIGRVSEAVGKALEMAGPEDMVFIGGSTFTVADIDGSI